MDVLSFLLGIFTLLTILLIAICFIGLRYDDKKIKAENEELKRELRSKKK